MIWVKRGPVRLILVFFLLTLPVRAQAWDTLRGLKAGERIRVVDSSGATQTGTFQAVSDSSITVAGRRGENAIERSKVKRVEVRSSARRTRNLLIGLGIGVAVGATVDQTVGTYLRNEANEGAGARALTYLVPTALFGAIGALPAYRTIYKVR
jgi:hypothetical protein